MSREAQVVTAERLSHQQRQERTRAALLSAAEAVFARRGYEGAPPAVKGGGVATRTRMTHEERRAQTREALIDAAEKVFARRGYEAGTLDEIAQAAGFTTGAIYSNFTGKEELFLAAFERRNAYLTEAYRSFLESTGGEVPDLKDIAGVWSRHERGDRQSLMLTLEFRLAALRDPKLRKQLGEFEARTDKIIAQFIAERLRAVGLDDPAIPVDDFAAVVYAANQGIWQHVAVCASDHSMLFEHFLELIASNWLSNGAQRDA